MNECFMFGNDKARVSGNGGGNKVSRSNLIKMRRSLAIGDALCSTIVADKLIQRGMDVVFQSHPVSHCLLRRHPLLAGVEEPNGFVDVNLDGCYENNGRRRFLHFHQMFMESANQQLARYGIRLGEPLNCKPRLFVSPQERDWAVKQFERYERPWVFICPRSDSYNVRQVPDGIWQEAAANIKGTKFWLGRHPAPVGIVDLRVKGIDQVLLWLSAADLLASVDTGPLHVAAALGIPIVAISQSSSPELHLNDQNDFIAISPKLDCLNCQANLCPKSAEMPPCQQVDPEMIAGWCNAKLRPLIHDGVSAVVPIYQPDAATLNHCLQNLVPQVDEIIVTAEMNSRIPADAFQHPKIHYVRKGAAGIGFGRNVNFGFRHTTHRYVMVVNDDCYLEPNVISHLRSLMVDHVGIVAHLLRYPSGKIYFAGKPRSPGGFYHIDINQFTASIQQPTEMENVCGCSFLIDRKAFYQADCFDEEFFMYAEDDDLCMKVRKAGWKIMYSPLVQGIHEGSKSSNTLPEKNQRMHESNVLFGRKWNRYIEHNRNVQGLGNFNYSDQ